MIVDRSSYSRYGRGKTGPTSGPRLDDVLCVTAPITGLSVIVLAILLG